MYIRTQSSERKYALWPRNIEVSDYCNRLTLHHCCFMCFMQHGKSCPCCDMFLSLFPYHLILDTQTLEQNAQDCTPEHVGQFLERIGLGHHVATFIEQDVSGDVLLEPDQEMLEELGVTSAIERLKIKVH